MGSPSRALPAAGPIVVGFAARPDPVAPCRVATHGSSNWPAVHGCAKLPKYCQPEGGLALVHVVDSWREVTRAALPQTGGLPRPLASSGSKTVGAGLPRARCAGSVQDPRARYAGSVQDPNGTAKRSQQLGCSRPRRPPSIGGFAARAAKQLRNWPAVHGCRKFGSARLGTTAWSRPQSGESRASRELSSNPALAERVGSLAGFGRGFSRAAAVHAARTGPPASPKAKEKLLRNPSCGPVASRTRLPRPTWGAPGPPSCALQSSCEAAPIRRAATPGREAF